MEELKILAKRVFNGMELVKFISFLDNDQVDEAYELAGEILDEAKDAVLEAVVNDECDFVLMSHYKFSYNLYTEFQKQEVI